MSLKIVIIVIGFYCFIAFSHCSIFDKTAGSSLHFGDIFTVPSKATIIKHRQISRPRASSNVDDNQLPASFILKSQLPNTTIVFECSLIVNNQAPLVEVVDQKIDQAGSNKRKPSCSYNGLAVFPTLHNRPETKCFVSLCGELRHGVVWLPSDDSHQQSTFVTFQLDEKLSTAKFSRSSSKLASSIENEQLVDSSKSGQRLRRSPQKGEAFDPKKQHQLLEDTYRAGWLHVRIAVLVTVESFNSDLLKSDPDLVSDFLSTGFGLINAIWLQLRVAVHLTRIIIWPKVADSSSSEIVEMPVGDWKNTTVLLSKLKPIASERLWPRLHDSADYIVVLRNVDRSIEISETAAFGATVLGTMCKGTFAEWPASGAALAISTAKEDERDERLELTAVEFGLDTTHELGHAFGMIHDEAGPSSFGQSCACEDGEVCVMSTKVAPGKLRWSWSNCSVAAFKDYRRMLPPYCLSTIPNLNLASAEVVPNATRKNVEPTCGDGIVQRDEECDCGPLEPGEDPLADRLPSIFCRNPNCCDRENCKLAKNAQCAFGPCCNTETCSYHGTDTICRSPITDQCDIAEHCTGQSSFCPEDVYLMTGTKCGLKFHVKDGSCYMGDCISRSLQCSALLGRPHIADKYVDTCYSLNKDGGNATNCGHGPFRSNGATSFTPCTEANKECGNLMCDGSDPAFLQKHFFYYSKTIYFDPIRFCSMIASPILPDFGHVPDGALCANGKRYCLNHECAKPVPKCTFPPCDNKATHVTDFEQGYLGIGKVTFHHPTGHKPSSFPEALVIEGQIPKRKNSFSCQLFANKRLSQVPVVDIIGQKSKPQVKRCHYSGVATFTKSGNRKSKCIASLCAGVQFGVIWIPDTEGYVQFELNNELTYAKYIEVNLGKSDKPPTDNEKIWTEQVLADVYPPDWLHIRIAVLVTVEAFGSEILDNNTLATVNFVTSSFGLINAIWSPLKIAIHLTRIIIWTDSDAAPEVVAMPEPDETDEEKMLKPLRKTAEKHLWPRIGDSADYIVVLRDMRQESSIELPPELGGLLDGGAGALDDLISGLVSGFLTKKARFGASSAKTLCRGTMANEPAHGAILAVSTELRKSTQKVIMEFVTIVTHELGHVFGLRHDQGDKQCTCEKAGKPLCLMSPSAESEPKLVYWSWSNCSKVDASDMRKVFPPLCLETIPPIPGVKKKAAICGNGVVEDEEQCDCGPVQQGIPIFCPNPSCCNQATCKLANGAKCASGACCDVTKCAFKPSSEICRPARSVDCDVAETCSGSVSFCPPDRYLYTGSKCGSDDTSSAGTCYKGECMSRDAQCLKVMQVHHHYKEEKIDCYSFNTKASPTSNCGHGWFRSDVNAMTQFITPCNETDKECGSLMCRLSSEYNVPPYHYLFRIWPTDQGKHCSMVAGTMLPDYGHVSDGTACNGGNGYCRNQRCVKLAKCSKKPPCDNTGNHIDDFGPTPKPVVLAAVKHLPVLTNEMTFAALLFIVFSN